MSRNFSRLASAIAIACATVSVPAFAQDHSGHHAGMSVSEHDAAKLHALFERSEAEALDRNPITAFFRGDFSDADKLGDFSPASYADERAAAESNLAELATVDRDALSETDRIAYDVFEYTQQRTLAMIRDLLRQHTRIIMKYQWT